MCTPQQPASTFAITPPTLVNDCGISTPCFSGGRLRGLFQTNEWPVTYDAIGQNVTSGPWSTINVDIDGQVWQSANFFVD